MGTTTLSMNSFSSGVSGESSLGRGLDCRRVHRATLWRPGSSLTIVLNLAPKKMCQGWSDPKELFGGLFAKNWGRSSPI
jgi:hypothetical protein